MPGKRRYGAKRIEASRDRRREAYIRWRSSRRRQCGISVGDTNRTFKILLARFDGRLRSQGVARKHQAVTGPAMYRKRILNCLSRVISDDWSVCRRRDGKCGQEKQ